MSLSPDRAFAHSPLPTNKNRARWARHGRRQATSFPNAPASSKRRGSSRICGGAAMLGPRPACHLREACPRHGAVAFVLSFPPPQPATKHWPARAVLLATASIAGVVDQSRLGAISSSTLRDRREHTRAVAQQRQPRQPGNHCNNNSNSNNTSRSDIDDAFRKHQCLSAMFV